MSMTGYLFLINDVLLPVTPGKLTIKINGKNKTYTLASGEEFNTLNSVGLTDYEFDILLPAHDEYSFARYVDGFLSPAWFLAFFADIAASKKPCTLRIIRTNYIGNSLATSAKQAMNLPYNQSARVSIENYTINEDASSGRDITVTIKLKQYIEYGTKLLRILEDGKTVSVVSSETTRQTDNAPKMSTYTCKEGDSILTLWELAKKLTGDATRYWEIVTCNSNISKNILEKNSLFLEEGRVIKLPW